MATMTRCTLPDRPHHRSEQPDQAMLYDDTRATSLSGFALLAVDVARKTSQCWAAQRGANQTGRD
jgi:hypothetical protein